MAKILTGITLLVLACSPALARAEVLSGVAAIVNDEIITTHEADKEYQQLLKDLDKAPAAEKMGFSRKVVLDRLVDKKLIEQKIRELDIKVSDDEVRASVEDVKKQNNLTQEQLEAALTRQGLTFDKYKVQLKEQMERLRLMSQEVRSKIQVGEKDVRDYYEAHRKDYGQEEVFRARQIFFKIDKSGGAAEMVRVEGIASKVLAEAKSGKDFAQLAMTYSNDPSAAKNGGDLGTFKRGDMLPELAETVANLKPGEVSALVLSPAGMHIIKLEEKSLSQGKPFEEVKADIEDLLYKKKSDERFSQWVKDLHASAAIEIKETK
ncbi:peptidylprolyl isomerase [Geomonas sp. Red875]|uniref:Peptidylprolyl isomerase n=2 Tax=Geomesophilobacter sediminis TaxID=2798584 RepID=A0A8J7JGA1_9BACT|nr:peptidylprolyl isomerase [Geomesophilobacter sediminis]